MGATIWNEKRYEQDETHTHIHTHRQTLSLYTTHTHLRLLENEWCILSYTTYQDGNDDDDFLHLNVYNRISEQ